MKTYILILVLLCSLKSFGQHPIILHPGATTIVPAPPGVKIAVENGAIIKPKDLGKTLQIHAKKQGFTRLYLNGQTIPIHVVSPSTHGNYKSLLTVVSKMKGLKLRVSHQKGIEILGTLLRVSDWQEISKFARENSIEYRFTASIESLIKEDLESWLFQELQKIGIPSKTILFQPHIHVSLDKSYKKGISQIKKGLRLFGLPVQIEELKISQKPSVLVELVLAEVDQSFERGLGILWGDGKYSANIAPRLEPQILSAQLNALETSGKGQILAKPKLLSRSGEKAEFHAGGEMPIRSSNWGQENVQWKKYGIMMNFSPKADSFGRMSLTIETEVAIPDLSRSSKDLPIFEINRVRSHFDLDKSRTVVISGLIRNSQSNFNQGLPFLSSIPILGRLFSSPSYRSRKTELIVFVTPKIFNPSELDSVKPKLPDHYER